MKPCIFLIAACLMDAVLTHFGISSGFIEEGNPMMREVIATGWTYFYLIKILLPLVLLGLFYLRPFKGRIRTLLISTCILYLSVLAYHMVWIVLYLNTST
ncbi:DUF5658 family protein [Neobacillus cucumis]|uniref:DUF5658 domain-containing protein n=1 Tax=Neobacillus cucumis TaxID=1740721 RepID=A0A2N5HJQ9_9BACI|nr:DUF5658 family protein [Neobacillus cucumis]PLS05769.1 hypothetical protein CVD27_08660 [Neobacillus cucumis]